MAQQINLHSPILLTQKRYFSALAMVQALGVLAIGLGGLGFYATHKTQELRSEVATAMQLNQTDRQRLQAQLAMRPALPGDTQALEQELLAATQALTERRRLRDELLAPPEQSRRAAVLRQLAQTAPTALWLNEVRLSDQRVELAGLTLQPEVLRPWLDQLAATPVLAGLALRSVKVERREGQPGEAQTWAFRVVSGDTEGPVADARRNGATP